GVVLLLQQLSRLGNGLVALDSEMGSLRGQKERVETACGEFRMQKGKAEQKQASEREEIQRLHSELERLMGARSRLEAAALEAQAEVDALEAERGKIVELLHQRRSRLEVLRSLEESLEGVGRGVADILRKKEKSPALLEVRGMAASL